MLLGVIDHVDHHMILFYDVLQLSVLIYLTGGVTNPFVMFIIVPAVVSSTVPGVPVRFPESAQPTINEQLINTAATKQNTKPERKGRIRESIIKTPIYRLLNSHVGCQTVATHIKMIQHQTTKKQRPNQPTG